MVHSAPINMSHGKEVSQCRLISQSNGLVSRLPEWQAWNILCIKTLSSFHRSRSMFFQRNIHRNEGNSGSSEFKKIAVI